MPQDIHQKLLDLIVIIGSFFFSFTPIKCFLRHIESIGWKKTIGFFVRLCEDVVFEVLCYDDRRKLTKLELIGRRFHFLSENFFGEMPVLRLDLKIHPGYLFFVFTASSSFL